ncbi:MAG TPA: lipid-A-disaccharide synthase N-terminal domain-containing protein [Candidatus Hydrogenedentes bacterium]|nr:lipid-A-disaccharide synthase N-terminal domain-containing protein [Candidatus Hydrogenedentota bacterium]
MSDWLAGPFGPRLWELVGIVAACIFYGRFYLQWIVSEIRKRSVVPIAFWYMSSVGSLLLLGYAAHIRSPIGALSHCFNIVVYARNLVHIWRERGALTRVLYVVVHGAVAVIVVGALVLAAHTWLREYHATKATGTAAANWFWIGVGAAGQGLFACRFLVQWVATERRRKSVVPLAFWYLSVAAAVLVAASHLQRREWIFMAGAASTLLVYLRNIWLIRRYGDTAADADPI